MLELEFNEAVSVRYTLFHCSSLLCVGNGKVAHSARISNAKVELTREHKVLLQSLET